MSKLRDSPRSYSGLFAIFCDLDEPDPFGFRPRLRENMFPLRKAIAFNAYASYDSLAGDGQQFLNLYEMPSLGYLYGDPYQTLRRN